MQFKISASLILAALAPLGVIPLPTQAADNGVSAHAPEDWKTSLGWDGKVNPVEEVGHFVEAKVHKPDLSTNIVPKV